MSQVEDQDVTAIREWLSKESYLPKTFNDLMLKKFIYSCHGSLERTKKCIDLFATFRAQMPEIFNNRNLDSKTLQDVVPYLTVAHFKDGDEEVIYHSLTEIPSNFDHTEFLKAYSIHLDYWMNIQMDTLPKVHYIVVDIKLFTLALFAKFNIFDLQKFLVALLESMPIRLKELHVVNCPSFYEYMYNLIKPALPEYVLKMINFHPDTSNLPKYISKKCIPSEWGGEAGSMVEQSTGRIKEIADKGVPYLADNYFLADLTKKPKTAGDTTMSGSFKTLAID